MFKSDSTLGYYITNLRLNQKYAQIPHCHVIQWSIFFSKMITATVSQVNRIRRFVGFGDQPIQIIKILVL